MVGRAGMLVGMHEQEYAIVRALVPVAWADGEFADKEKEMLEALLDAYGATDDQEKHLREYAKEKRTIDDIDLQELSAADRRVLLQNAVLVSFADGEQHPSEAKLLLDLAAKLRIPEAEAKAVMAEAEARAKKHLTLLG
jgi:tellurite resistance protein